MWDTVEDEEKFSSGDLEYGYTTQVCCCLCLTQSQMVCECVCVFVRERG